MLERERAALDAGHELVGVRLGHGTHPGSSAGRIAADFGRRRGEQLAIADHVGGDLTQPGEAQSQSPVDGVADQVRVELDPRGQIDPKRATFVVGVQAGDVVDRSQRSLLERQGDIVAEMLGRHLDEDPDPVARRAGDPQPLADPVCRPQAEE